MRLALLVTVALALAACENTPTEPAADPAPADLAVTPERMAELADTPTDTLAEAMPEAGPARLAGGAFAGAGRHDVSGAAALYELADGTHLVRLDSLVSDNGPQLEVWLVRRTDGDVIPGGLSLGALKSVRGDQNFPVAEGVDVSAFEGVAVWCRRFGVTFGVAPLAPPASQAAAE